MESTSPQGKKIAQKALVLLEFLETKRVVTKKDLQQALELTDEEAGDVINSLLANNLLGSEPPNGYRYLGPKDVIAAWRKDHPTEAKA
jgi:predicted HTH transcriptional regulator